MARPTKYQEACAEQARKLYFAPGDVERVQFTPAPGDDTQ